MTTPITIEVEVDGGELLSLRVRGIFGVPAETYIALHRAARELAAAVAREQLQTVEAVKRKSGGA